MKKILALVVLGLIWGYEANAADLYVPSQYSTIQSAVNTVNPGDTVYVVAGSYNEVVYIDKSIAMVDREYQKSFRR
ncbi:MAG: hypothetical protein AB1422_10260 [bacterium]